MRQTRLVSILSLASLFWLLQGTASAQLHTFRNGEVADATKLNESLQYILNNASGGCSATQQGSNVLIECADGSSGLLSSEGTVVAYPEGLAGEVDPMTFDEGDIVVVDAAGTQLGLLYYGIGTDDTGIASANIGFNVDSDLISSYTALSCLAVNDRESQKVIFGCGSTTFCELWDDSGDAPVCAFPDLSERSAVWFLSADCSGEPLAKANAEFVLDGQFFKATDRNYCADNQIAKSYRPYDVRQLGSLPQPVNECVQQVSVRTLCQPVPITPPAVWDTAVYPIDIQKEQ